MRDIASIAGVSAASVSRAMRDPKSVSQRTRVLVEQAMQQIKEDNTQSREVASTTIGCVFLDSTSNLEFTGYDATIWGGLARVAMQRGADLILINFDAMNTNGGLHKLVRKHNIGALAIRCDEASNDILREINDAGLPAITIAHKHEFPNIGYICVNSRESSRDAVEHLILLGHRRIAFSSNLIRDQDHEDRRNGYRDALAKHDIEADEALEIYTHSDPEGGVTAINRLLAVPNPPTAIYFADPVPTVTALRRLCELGIGVPKEMSIIGFDDDNMRHLGNPIYSSVCQDAKMLAEMAGQFLFRMIRSPNDAKPPRIELDSYIEINETTDTVPGAFHQR